MSKILSIDPGSEKTGYVIIDRSTKQPIEFGKITNSEFMNALQQVLEGADVIKGQPKHLNFEFDSVACEFPVPRGQLSSKDMFKTIWWIGRFYQVIYQHMEISFVDRKDVKMHICGIPNAKDTNIRQALIDLYGGESIAIGGKKCKGCNGKGTKGRQKEACEGCAGAGLETPRGPLNGLAGDAWSALAISVTYANGAAKPAIDVNQK